MVSHKNSNKILIRSCSRTVEQCAHPMRQKKNFEFLSESEDFNRFFDAVKGLVQFQKLATGW